MLNKKWIASAVLAAFLTVGVGTGTTQAYANGLGHTAIKAAAADTVELSRHHRGPAPRHIDHHRGPAPKHISHHRGPRHPGHHQPPPRHHSHSNNIVGSIVGGIIGGILVNSSK